MHRHKLKNIVRLEQPELCPLDFLFEVRLLNNIFTDLYITFFSQKILVTIWKTIKDKKLEIEFFKAISVKCKESMKWWRLCGRD